MVDTKPIVIDDYLGIAFEGEFEINALVAQGRIGEFVESYVRPSDERSDTLRQIIGGEPARRGRVSQRSEKRRSWKKSSNSKRSESKLRNQGRSIK